MDFRIAIVVILLVPVSSACQADVNTPHPITPEAPGSIVFLTQNSTTPSQMTSLFNGVIDVDSAGCLRLVSSTRATIVWPYGYTIHEQGTQLRIINSKGHDAGQIGGTFRLSGGIVESLNTGIPVSREVRQRGMQSCPGSFWIVGED